MKIELNESRLRIVRTTMPPKPSAPKPPAAPKGGGCGCGGKGGK